VPFGHPAYEIIDHYAQRYGFPVGYNFPIGHEPTNEAVVVGRRMTLTVGPEGSRLG